MMLWLMAMAFLLFISAKAFPSDGYEGEINGDDSPTKRILSAVAGVAVNAAASAIDAARDAALAGGAVAAQIGSAGAAVAAEMGSIESASDLSTNDGGGTTGVACAIASWRHSEA